MKSFERLPKKYPRYSVKGTYRLHFTCRIQKCHKIVWTSEKVFSYVHMDTGKDLFLCPDEKIHESGLFIYQGEKGLEFSFNDFISKFSFPIWEWVFPPSYLSRQKGTSGNISQPQPVHFSASAYGLGFEKLSLGSLLSTSVTWEILKSEVKNFSSDVS